MSTLRFIWWAAFCVVVGFAVAWLNYQYVLYRAVQDGDLHYSSDVDGNVVLEWE